MKQPLSLHTRILILLIAAEVLLVGAFGIGTLRYTTDQLTKSFDAGLLANAEAIAMLVLEDPEEDHSLELEFSDEVMTRFARKKRPEVFSVLLPTGELIERSPSLKEVPDWVSPVKEKVIHNFSHLGIDYRGIVLPSRAQIEDMEARDDRPGLPIVVFYATSRDELDEDLQNIQTFIVLFAGLIFAVSAIMAYWIARVTLIPLHELASSASEIDATTLDRRFKVESMPVDLQPLAETFNQLLARLEEAFERERRFSADVAHELRTPVAVLKSGIQSALLAPANSVADREALVELQEDAVRIEELCESLLLLSRSEVRGEREQKAEPPCLRIEEFLHEAKATIESLRPLERENESLVELSLEGECPCWYQIDTDSVRRILTNLLENALRHGGKKVVVKIILQLNELGMRVTVQDNGPGIPKALQSRLFERFARADESRTRSTGGVGLGLAISKALAEQSGGSLELDFSTAHQGSRFVWQILKSETPDNSTL